MESDESWTPPSESDENWTLRSESEESCTPPSEAGESVGETRVVDPSSREKLLIAAGNELEPG